MTHKHSIDKDIIKISLSGDLIGEESNDIIKIADDAIAEGLILCVVDISEIRYINSSGIGVLITLLTKFRNKEGEMCLIKPSENVKKLLIITKLNAIFKVAQSYDEAIDIVHS